MLTAGRATILAYTHRYSPSLSPWRSGATDVAAPASASPAEWVPSRYSQREISWRLAKTCSVFWYARRRHLLATGADLQRAAHAIVVLAGWQMVLGGLPLLVLGLFSSATHS